MGLVAVPRVLVEEWVRPAPFTAVGDAFVVVEGSATCVGVSVAVARLVPDAAAAVRVAVVGSGTVAPFGDVQSRPRSVASATVMFDNSTTAGTGRVTGCLALVPIVARCDVVVVTSGTAGVLVVQQGAVLVPVVGDAEVEFAYYGDGNFPVFPYFLPALFTDNPQNLQDASATVAVSGDVGVDAVAGFASASLSFTGDVVLIRKGSTPILPWFFPVVFDDLPANVNVGAARVSFDMSCECVVELVGESAVSITGVSFSVGSAVFPWAFPVVLAA